MKIKPKLLVLGHAGHGKDSLAYLISRKLNYKYKEPSLIIAEKFLFPMLGEFLGYPSAYKMFLNRSKHRPLWAEVMAAINYLDPARLTKEILRTQDIYVGIRRFREYEASKDFFDLILWVDASKRLPLEPESSMEFTGPPAEAIVIDNNREKRDFEQNIPWDLFK